MKRLRVYNKNQARTSEHKNLVRKPWYFFQPRILYRRNGKRILSENEEKQGSGKARIKIIE
jgi:hypothetical protein